MEILYIIYNSSLLHPISSRFNGSHALVCTPNFKAIKQSTNELAKAIWSVAKRIRRRKYYEENETNFYGAYVGNSGVDSAQIWYRSHSILRDSLSKIYLFLVRECWATDAWKQHFLYYYKIHTSLLQAPGSLGCTTDTLSCFLI